MSADLGNGDPRPLSERCSRKHQPSSWAVWYVVTSAILVSLQTCPLERFMVEQAPPPQLMKREMHGGAIPLGPKQASKIKGIPFLKCLLLLRERFFLAFRATKPGSGWCMRKESNSFSSFWDLEVISLEDSRRVHYIWQNQKRAETSLIFIYSVLATKLQSEQRPWLPSLQSWISAPDLACSGTQGPMGRGTHTHGVLQGSLVRMGHPEWSVSHSDGPDPGNESITHLHPCQGLIRYM